MENITTTKEIPVMELIQEKNEMLARELNNTLTEQGVFVINVMGAPGVGKTSTLINVISRIEEESYVIEGDIESDIDTKKLHELGIKTHQINTGGACHLDSPLIGEIVPSMNINGGYLWIENIGNLVCPAEFMIGEHIKMLIVSVTDGSDKPYKYPLAFEKADIIILNKVDLIPYVDFDKEMFLRGVKALNNTAPIFETSAKNKEGYNEAVQWIKERARNIIKR